MKRAHEQGLKKQNGRSRFSRSGGWCALVQWGVIMLRSFVLYPTLFLLCSLRWLKTLLKSILPVALKLYSVYTYIIILVVYLYYKGLCTHSPRFSYAWPGPFSFMAFSFSHIFFNVIDTTWGRIKFFFLLKFRTEISDSMCDGLKCTVSKPLGTKLAHFI